jgi:hypothetical protein
MGYEARGIAALVRHASPACSLSGQAAVMGVDASEPVQVNVPILHLIVAGVVVAVTAEIFFLTLNIKPRR